MPRWTMRASTGARSGQKSACESRGLALLRPSPGAAEAPARLRPGIDALQRRLNRRQGARDVGVRKSRQGETLARRAGYRRAEAERRLRRHGYEKDTGEDESVMSGQDPMNAN